MIRFPLVITVSKRDMPGIKPGPLGWQNSAPSNELQEVRITDGSRPPVIRFSTWAANLSCVSARHRTWPL